MPALLKRAILVLSLILIWPTLAFSAGPFRPNCTIPFEDIATENLSIDAQCGFEGTANDDRNAAQNREKNNLCANGRPVSISYSAFKSLQKKVDLLDISYGSHNSLPEDRNDLKKILKYKNRNIGEGTVVRYVGFINHPRYSNTGKGESVNCKHSGKTFNDIHVDLVRRKGENVCRSITMEIIPHFRPEYWEVDVLKEITHPVRITGQLFFDGSHKPCTKDKVRNPKRITVWEIHPVYAIDVCKRASLGSCSVSKKAAWVPLDEWANIANDDGEE